MTGYYSAVNWYRCLSRCGAAKELLLCLFVYQLLSQQSRCVSRRNQILQPNLPRWQARKTRRGEKSTRSSKMERRIRNNLKNKSTPSPPQTHLFGQNSATELDLFGCLRKAKDELLARGVFLLLSRSATPLLRPLLVAELDWSRWDRDLRTANMTVTTRANPPSSHNIFVLLTGTKGRKPKVTGPKRWSHPGKRNVETGTNSVDISFLVFCWFSARCCFLGFQCIFRRFKVLVRTTIHIPIQHYVSILLSVS